ARKRLQPVLPNGLEQKQLPTCNYANVVVLKAIRPPRFDDGGVGRCPLLPILEDGCSNIGQERNERGRGQASIHCARHTEIVDLWGAQWTAPLLWHVCRLALDGRPGSPLMPSSSARPRECS